MYDKDIHASLYQLQMLPDLVKAFRKSQNLSKLTVTKMSTVADMLVSVPMAKDVFSEIDKMLPSHHSSDNFYCKEKVFIPSSC